MSSFEHNEVKARIHHYLISKTNFLQVKDTMQDDQLRTFVDNAINKLCEETKLAVTLDERHAIIRELAASIISLGPLRAFAEDPSVSEIMVTGQNQFIFNVMVKLKNLRPIFLIMLI